MTDGPTRESVLTRAVSILECFDSDSPVLTVSEISRRTGLHVATASRLIEELVTHRLLERDTERRVRVNVHLWELASRALPALSLRDTALPVMQMLHRIVGHNVQLGIRDDADVLVLERLIARNAVQNVARLAGRLPLAASSAGLVLLAYGPPGVAETVLAGRLERFTPYTVTAPGQLRRIIADTRLRGYALCRGFFTEDATGIAVPLRDGRGTVIAALSIVVPNDANAHNHLPALQAAAQAISETLAQQRGR
ncbi:helix-turn-helix domain-containing protein [Gordonia amarae]|uniref:Helix-turn-helix domain-containing protein n=2 Tax=Gordonia amarae TaxID=36821 RepID=A0A857M8Y3_9ACTN|nr:IclR family transcriptional regulator [Gordonia amarae]MCS3877862.1 DNA-binding IclR family transcriptional regulator [Gordonia amarae]QHN16585.1 helix-turn-helix domain-containing protein [Gordonia amarae]QHN21110.1 helix-turn-helix domain-containing protein [Gordonia amarae]QHN29963.1 helix-turn-helix domain-containing protein [Gordonia amarae]QHN38738.1 helix-turn-helix domain-containing protein [Gordonia amarae]